MAFERRLIPGLILAGASLLFACSGSIEPTEPPIPATTPSAVPISMPTSLPTGSPTPLPPFFSEWRTSSHAQASEAIFPASDEAETTGIPPACAKCHSSASFLELLGADGKQSGMITPAGAEDGINCQACHSDVSSSLDAVSMPSGVVLSGLGADAVCMQCHLGRVAGSAIDLATKSLAPNGISTGLEFVSVHFGPAGATLYGSAARGGYEYPGRAYGGRFTHAPGFSSCTGCHDAHGLQVKFAECADCHPETASSQDLVARLRISTVDYDADGNTTEGVAGEVETMRLDLAAAIRAYAEKSGHPIDYQSDRDPYFFDEDGAPYRTWTPLLLKAAYNLHFVTMDPGAFAHNPTYAMQLLYDSIQDLGGDIIGLVRP